MPSSFRSLIAKLDKGRDGFTDLLLTDPFEIILYEYIAYLADDEKRNLTFRNLRDSVGLTAATIANSSIDVLLKVTSKGGIHAEERAKRIRLAAEMVMEDFGGDLKTVLSLPPSKAKKEFRRFPSIGEPGAEKILLFSGTLPVLALESNGLRVLLRVGFGEDHKNYSTAYRSAQEAIELRKDDDCEKLIHAYRVLRRHGKELCKTNAPICRACPVQGDCKFYATQSGAR